MNNLYYVHTVPNSHSWGSLEEILVNFKHQPNEMTKDYILIGLRNALEYGRNIKKIADVHIDGFYFTNLTDMIRYIEEFDWNPNILIEKISSTLNFGYDLKCERKMERSEAYNHINIEREYQDLRWSTRREENGTPDNEKSPAEWINYIEYHIGEAKREVYNLNDEEALAHVRKVAALAIRCLELHGCPERIIPMGLTKEG